MRNFVEKLLSWLALLVTAFHTLLASCKANEECGHEKVIECTRPLERINSNGLAFVTKKEQLEEQCPQLESSIKCIQTYSLKCMKENQREHFNSFYTGTNMVIRELCHEGPYQDEFLKHAQCLGKVKDEYELCYKKYERAVMEIGRENRTVGHDGSLKTICCTFKEYLDCTHHSVRRQCGEDAAQFTKDLFDRMTTSFLKMHCVRYTNEECAIGSSGSISRIGTMLPVVLVLLARYFT